MRGGVGSRRSVRYAAVAAAALVAGLLPGTDSAASGGTGSLSLVYACQFASGEQDVTAKFSQQFPANGAVGIPLQPGELTLSVSVPRAGATALLPADAATVTADAGLTAHVTQGPSAADVQWTGLKAPQTAVPGTGDLVVTLTGTVPAVTVTAPGDVTFAAGALTLTLHPQTAAGTATPAPSGGATTDPAAPSAAATPSATDQASVTSTPADVTGACTARPGQDAALGTVPVPAGPGPGGRSGPGAGAAGSRGPAVPATGGPPGAPASGSPSAGRGPYGTIVPQDQQPHSGVSTCGPTPAGDLDPSRLPTPPPGSIVLPFPGQPPFPDVPMCGFVVGFSNVKKLNGAMILNDPYAHPALTDINLARRRVFKFTGDSPYVEADSTALMVLPPSHATFLTYGFMPTTAEVDFVPLGVMTVVSTGDVYYQQPIVTVISGYQEIRIRHVRINGTPLDVGPNCRTSRPVDVVLTGRKDDYLPVNDGRPDYDIQTGGPLTDMNLVIPPFTGCGTDRGHGEDLDSLFTASLSGSGNTLNLVQGRLCDPVTQPETTCQPEIPIPPLPVRKSAP